MHVAVQYSPKRLQELLKHESTGISNEPGHCVHACACALATMLELTSVDGEEEMKIDNNLDLKNGVRNYL